jgi:hypothetical protein
VSTPSGKPPHRGARVLAAAAPALLLLAVSLWEIVAVARSHRNVPDEEDWGALSAALRERHRPGDLIVFAPRWIDPVGRQYLGDLIPIEMAARMDAARFPVVWEVSQDGADEVAGSDPTWSEDFGPLSLRRHARAAAVVATDFVAGFAGAKVTGRTSGRPQVSLEEVGFEPHRCVKVVPQPDQTVEIAYDGVELGRELVVYAGLADVFTRRDIREPGELTVTIDGVPFARRTLGIDDGWVRLGGATEPRAAARVVFAARAVGAGARDRRICFAAEARR